MGIHSDRGFIFLVLLWSHDICHLTPAAHTDVDHPQRKTDQGAKKGKPPQAGKHNAGCVRKLIAGVVEGRVNLVTGPAARPDK